MTGHAAPLEAWHAALTKALHDGAVAAVPGILVRMALDGWGHEAETARRAMVTASKVLRRDPAQDAFDRAEAEDEAEQIQRGGNR